MLHHRVEALPVEVVGDGGPPGAPRGGVQAAQQAQVRFEGGHGVLGEAEARLVLEDDVVQGERFDLFHQGRGLRPLVVHPVQHREQRRVPLGAERAVDLADEGGLRVDDGARTDLGHEGEAGLEGHDAHGVGAVGVGGADAGARGGRVGARCPGPGAQPVGGEQVDDGAGVRHAVGDAGDEEAVALSAEDHGPAFQVAALVEVGVRDPGRVPLVEAGDGPGECAEVGVFLGGSVLAAATVMPSRVSSPAAVDSSSIWLVQPDSRGWRSPTPWPG